MVIFMPPLLFLRWDGLAVLEGDVRQFMLAALEKDEFLVEGRLEEENVAEQ